MPKQISLQCGSIPTHAFSSTLHLPPFLSPEWAGPWRHGGQVHETGTLPDCARSLPPDRWRCSLPDKHGKLPPGPPTSVTHCLSHPQQLLLRWWSSSLGWGRVFRGGWRWGWSWSHCWCQGRRLFSFCSQRGRWCHGNSCGPPAVRWWLFSHCQCHPVGWRHGAVLGLCCSEPGVKWCWWWLVVSQLKCLV